MQMSRRSAAVKSEGKDRTTHTDLARIRAALFFFLDDPWTNWRGYGRRTKRQRLDRIWSRGRVQWRDCTVHVSHHCMPVKESVDEANPSQFGTWIRHTAWPVHLRQELFRRIGWPNPANKTQHNTTINHGHAYVICDSDDACDGLNERRKHLRLRKDGSPFQ